jgi:hypothetical protein
MLQQFLCLCLCFMHQHYVLCLRALLSHTTSSILCHGYDVRYYNMITHSYAAMPTTVYA